MDKLRPRRAEFFECSEFNSLREPLLRRLRSHQRPLSNHPTRKVFIPSFYLISIFFTFSFFVVVVRLDLFLFSIFVSSILCFSSFSDFFQDNRRPGRSRVWDMRRREAWDRRPGGPEGRRADKCAKINKTVFSLSSSADTDPSQIETYEFFSLRFALGYGGPSSLTASLIPTYIGISMYTFSPLLRPAGNYAILSRP